MRIGLDFDNTMVCYDDLFHRAARERNLIPAELPRTKSDVRDFLRRAGREEAWTRLQAEAYGARMSEAAAFPGVHRFFRQCRAWGVRPLIISHRSRTPYLGPAYDLHQSARRWLQDQGFLGEEGLGVSLEDVFFELTREKKLRRIALARCSIFLDDLPEFLSDPAFPPRVQRVLFDPSGTHCSEIALTRVGSWREFARLVERKAARHG